MAKELSIPIYERYGSISGEVANTVKRNGSKIDSFQWGGGRAVASPTGSSPSRKSSTPAVSEIGVKKPTLFRLSNVKHYKRPWSAPAEIESPAPSESTPRSGTTAALAEEHSRRAATLYFHATCRGIGDGRTCLGSGSMTERIYQQLS